MKKESIHEIYLRCKRLMELKKFIAEHKEEIKRRNKETNKKMGSRTRREIKGIKKEMVSRILPES